MDEWQKSSFCKADTPQCVSVSGLSEKYIRVRDDKAPEDALLTFTRDEWQKFVDGVKAGEFDLK